MKTRERILQTSLQLFNEYGAPRITTNHIADEMNISPGNLYYHFRNKDEIIYHLFMGYEKKISDALQVPQSRDLNMEDMWLYLHLVFESIWEYRFLYRDLDNIVSRSRKLRLRFKRILERKIKTAGAIFEGLVQTRIIRASAEEVQALATNVAVVATYWINFYNIRHDNQNSNDNNLGQGVYQVMALVAPFLREDMRKLLQKLSHDYLD
ncbi:MAG TPA: TetR/AcrR family transcriptional regulator [Saprospiraceae bacterium]|nr:TetR/AcrR family transcriptional regulator [Saprospiraceae bacterium]